jgi:ubiquinone/menaquinone biosynthesis C-methylase UbiE
MNKIFICLLIVLASCANNSRNSKYLDPNLNAEMWNEGLQNPEKDIVVYRKEILSHLPVKRGDSIADVGAGTGQFEKELSQLVGPVGKIYAVEVAPAFIPFMKERFLKEGLKNVQVVHGKTQSTTLEKSSVNLIVVVDTYHHFDRPESMLKDFKKILKPQGHLVIIDFRRGPNARPWVNSHMHLTREDIINEVSGHGFEFLREEEIPFKESFQLTFRMR